MLARVPYTLKIPADSLPRQAYRPGQRQPCLRIFLKELFVCVYGYTQ